MFIENVSLHDAHVGNHYDPGTPNALIQIVDPGTSFPTTRFHFDEVLQVSFWDLDPRMGVARGGAVLVVKELEAGEVPHGTFTEEQAERIVTFLKRQAERRASIIVHCHAGLCRSGAVVEAAIALGYQDTGRTRIPNVYVKRLLFQKLRG